MNFSGFRSEINIAASELGSELERELGTALTYSPRSGTGYTVYGILWKTEKTFEEMIRLKIQKQTRRITIHSQNQGTVFPPTTQGITVNDTLYNPEDGITYQITKVSNPDSVGAEWELETVFALPRAVGDVN